MKVIGVARVRRDTADTRIVEQDLHYPRIHPKRVHQILRQRGGIGGLTDRHRLRKTISTQRTDVEL